MTPLDVTRKTTFDLSFLETLRKTNDHVGEFIYSFAQQYLGFFKATQHSEEAFMHDPTAIAALCYPEIFTSSRRVWVRVETCSKLLRGATVCDLRPWEEHEMSSNPLNVNVYFDVNSGALLSHFKQAISNLPKSPTDRE